MSCWLVSVGNSTDRHARGINAGSKDDTDDFCAALSSAQMQLDDIIDCVFPFDKAEEAIEYVWQGKQVGKVVINVRP